jgi:hypothetical protein
MEIAGLPLATWLLMIAATGAGLAIELAFFRAHRRDRHPNADEPAGRERMP